MIKCQQFLVPWQYAEWGSAQLENLRARAQCHFGPLQNIIGKEDC